MKRCFVVAPIGKDGSEIRRRSNQILKHVIRPPLTDLGYTKIVRADEIPDPGIITAQVVEHIKDDELVVADLTGGNPNVYYELALRHALRKPFIQLIQAGEDLPFDIRGMRTIEVDYRDLDSAEQAREQIRQQVESLEKDPDSLTTPLSVAVDIQQMRSTRDPEAQVTAELLEITQKILRNTERLSIPITRSDSEPSFRKFIYNLTINGVLSRGQLEELRRTLPSKSLRVWVDSLIVGLSDPWSMPVEPGSDEPPF